MLRLMNPVKNFIYILLFLKINFFFYLKLNILLKLLDVEGLLSDSSTNIAKSCYLELLLKGFIGDFLDNNYLFSSSSLLIGKVKSKSFLEKF